MKRRSFLKSAIAGTAASLLPSGVVSLASGCSSGNATGISWNFDEIIDRSGTWSVKHSRAEGGKLAMWIADMDFRTDPVVIRALRESFMKTLRSAKLNETPIPSLVATIAAYTHEPVWLEDLKHYLEGNIEYTVQTLDGSSGIRAVKPEASFVVWLDCRQLGLRQPELVSLFNDMAGVVVNNGISYGTGGEGFVRLNVGCPRSIVEEALERILGQVRLIS